MYLQRDSSRDLFEFQKLSDKPNVWGSSWGHDSNHLVDGFSYRKRRISSAKARGQQCQPLIPAYRMLFPKNMYILPPSLRVYSLNSERYLILSIYILQMINWINKQQQSPPFWKTNNPLPQPPKRRVEPTVSPSGRRWWHWRKSPHPSHSRDRRVQGLGSIPEDSSWRKPWIMPPRDPSLTVLLDGLLRVFCLAKMERKWRMGVDVGSNGCLMLGEGW